MIAAITEALVTFSIIRDAPPLLTSVGVAYLVIVERRRARQLAQLERTARELVAGHTGGVDAHRNLAVTLKETPHHVH